jgi:hypothetical protein
MITAVAACVVSAFAASAAQAQTVTLTLGQSQFAVGLTPQPPTGTLKASGNHISSACNSGGLFGAPLSPICTLRTVQCPVTATICDVTAAIQETVVLGQANVVGAVTFGNFVGAPFTAVVGQSNTCPQNQLLLGSCSAQATALGLHPGETVTLTVANVASGNVLPAISGQLNVDVNS